MVIVGKCVHKASGEYRNLVKIIDFERFSSIFEGNSIWFWKSGNRFPDRFLSRSPWVWTVSCFEKCPKRWFRKRSGSVSAYGWFERSWILQFFVDFDRFGLISVKTLTFCVNCLQYNFGTKIVLPVSSWHSDRFFHTFFQKKCEKSWFFVPKVSKTENFLGPFWGPEFGPISGFFKCSESLL